MPKKVRSLALGLFLALAGFACAALFADSAHALGGYDEYEPFDGDGWSITADGVMTIESNQGWVNCLKHGFRGNLWKLVLGKDVTSFRMYSLPDDLPTEDFFGKEDIIGRDQYGNAYYDYQIFWGLFPSEIVVEEGNSVFRIVDGLLINMDTNELVLSEMDVQDVVVPEGIQSITREAFFKRPLVSIRFPASLQKIAEYAFAQCEGLKSVELPDSLIRLGDSAFSMCSALEQVTLSKSLQVIEQYTFNACGLRHVEIPENVREIGRWAFYGCEQLESVTLQTGLRTIARSAFCNCMQLQYINLPDGLESIGAEAFSGCYSLKQTILLPDTLLFIGNKSFWGCDLPLLRIPEELTFLIFDDRNLEFKVNPHAKKDKSFELSSVETVIFSGSDYDFGYPAITDAKNVYFLSTPPEDVGQILDKDSVENIYCSDAFEHQWTRSSVASWVRQRLTILPAAEIKALTEEAVNATPEPIVTPSPTPTPRPTETPWPTPIITPAATPRQEAPAERKPIDPILFVFAGVIAVVIAGIAVVAANARRTSHKKRRPKNVKGK